MTDPIVIRASKDHFHVHLNNKTHGNQTWDEAWWLLYEANYDPSWLLMNATPPSRIIESIEYRRVGRHRWWVDGRPLPLKVVRYILIDECGCSKEQCDLIIQSLKLSDQCRQLRERIENETMNELYRSCREWLRNKSRQSTSGTSG